MPRCCEPVPDEFRPCYASVLAHGREGLRPAVEALEAGPLVPCFTAWCHRCHRRYLLAPDREAFPCPSAHHAHKLALLAGLRAAGIYPDA